MGMALGHWWRPAEMPTVATAPAAGPAIKLANSLSGDASQRLSASDRIQLVSNAVEGADATGDPAVQVLINTLNFDPNANVRLAAAGALYRLRADPRVGEAFTQSLAIQTDPNVQILLIELLVNMRERRATSQLEQLSKKPDALPIVRQQAEYGLGTLI
jgi:HEAT repeat protein